MNKNSIKIISMSGNKKSKESFFKSLFSSFLGGNDEESIKRKKIKQISKRFNKSKFAKYYKFSSNEISPYFPKLFCDIYKLILPAQRFFDSYKNKNVFIKMVINSNLPEEIKQIESSLTEENIKNIAKELPIENLKTQAEEQLTAFNDYFTAERVSKIELSYKQLMAFRDFCEFDFFFMLKKFNKSLSESTINKNPNFEKISAEYVEDDLKDFADVIYSMPEFSDWTPLFEILKYLPGDCNVSLQVWKKIVSRILILKQSNALLMMIQMISNDPNYVVIKKDAVLPITEKYLENMRNEITSIISKLVEEEKRNKTSQAVENLFGSQPTDFLKFYTEEANREFKAKQLSQFSCCNALNFLKAFLNYFVKTDLKEFYEILIVRGKWESPTLCAPVSNAYHSLTFVSDKITMFDEEFAESKVTGMKIKNLILKASRDNTSRNIINRIVNESNDTAKEIIVSTMKNIIIIGKMIKSLIEDLSKQKPIMLTNWKEVEHFCDEPMKEYLIRLYKKIFQFSELIKSNL